MAKLTFQQWADQQLGSRTHNFKAMDDEELQENIRQLEAYKVELERRHRYDELRNSALLGWSVKGEDKVTS